MLTKTNGDGTWSCAGIKFHEISGEVYGALCRLRDYEKTGFDPDELYKVKENIHVGSIIHGYTVFGIFNDVCIAENPNAPEQFVVWRIENDGFGVMMGSYFLTFEEAKKHFFHICLHQPNIKKKDYWKL